MRRALDPSLNSALLKTSEEQACSLKMIHDPEEVCFLSQHLPPSYDDTKVQVLPERRGLSHLRSNFRQISNDVLTRVWESNNESWDVCFDVLNAWVASHGPVLISVEQLEFVLDTEEWPHLPSASLLLRPHLSPLSQLSIRVEHLTLSQTDTRPSDLMSINSLNSESGSICGTSDGWSFCEDASEDGNDTRSSDIGDHWVEVEAQGGPEGPVSDCPSTSVPTRRSFRDVLLSASSPQSRSSTKRPRSSSDGGDDSNNVNAKGACRVWRPRIVCVSLQGQRQRCDVVYMNSPVMKDALAWDHVYDEEEEDIYGGVTCGHGNSLGYSGSKSFAQAALSNALRMRGMVQQGNNEGVKVLRCKY